MVNIILGAVGALAVMLLIALGVFIGWNANNAFRSHSNKVAAEEASEEERRQLLADQRAFEAMLNYNQDTAYGMHKGLDEMAGEG